MADRKPTVISPGGNQENLLDADNLVAPAAPTSNSHLTNKEYVDARDTNLQDQIDLLAGGSLDNRYVERAGDNVTGNITFDTDKIVLNADGSASFSSSVSIDGAATLGSSLNTH